MVNDPSLVEYTRGGDEPRGPVSFAVSGDEIIVDSDLRPRPRLVIYRDGRTVRTVVAPAGGRQDLLVEGTRYWILGYRFGEHVVAGETTQDLRNDATEYVLEKGADRLTRVSRTVLPPETGIAASGTQDPDAVQWSGGLLQRTDTGLFAVPLVGSGVLLEGTGSAPEALDAHSSGTTLVIEDPGFTARISTRGTDATVRLWSRRGGHVYHQVLDGEGANWGYLYQFTTTGTLVHTYTLHPGYATNPARPLVVTDDGRVYQLLISTRTARVLRIPPN